MPLESLPRTEDLARRQGARAGRFGVGPAVNPFDPQSVTGRAWEAGRLAVCGDQFTLGLDESSAHNIGREMQK